MKKRKVLRKGMLNIKNKQKNIVLVFSWGETDPRVEILYHDIAYYKLYVKISQYQKNINIISIKNLNI